VEAVEWTCDKNKVGEKVVDESRNLLPDIISIGKSDFRNK
jgi:hypothetical protein